MNHCQPAPLFSAQHFLRPCLPFHLCVSGLPVLCKSPRMEMAPTMKGGVPCEVHLCIPFQTFVCAYIFRPRCTVFCYFYKIGIFYTNWIMIFFHLIVFNELVFPQHLDSVHVWFFQSKEREKVLVFWGVNDMLFTIDDGAADTRLSYCNLDGCILYMQTLRKVINLQKKILSSRTFSSVFRVVIFS